MSRLRLLTADPQTLQADEMVAQARRSLAAGRRHEARRWLWDALNADPHSVRAWLMLAAMASPRASLSYVTRALELRPHNPVAHRALEWAQGRLEQAPSPQTQLSRGTAEAAAVTLFHAPPIEEAEAQEASPKTQVSRGQAEAAAAETLLHAPDLEATVAEVELADEAAEEPPPEVSSAAETLLHAPDLAATVAEVELADEAEEPEGPAAPPAVEATVAEVALDEAGDELGGVETTAPHPALPASDEDEEDESPTAPHKAVPRDWPAGPAARTLIGIVVIALIGLVAVALGDWLAQPARPAAIAAAPVEHYQKSTDAPFPTDTPTVTPSPTITPTFTPTPSVTPTPPASPTPAPFEAWAGGGQARWIDVNLSLQMLTAMEGERPVQTFLVSTGLWGTPTVIGDYQVYVKYPAADMSGPGYYLPSVPYVMYFHKGYGIHGTYWHNNFGNPMSHGCVNMRTDQAGWLFDWASVGTLVHVHY